MFSSMLLLGGCGRVDYKYILSTWLHAVGHMERKRNSNSPNTLDNKISRKDIEKVVSGALSAALTKLQDFPDCSDRSTCSDIDDDFEEPKKKMPKRYACVC